MARVRQRPINMLFLTFSHSSMSKRGGDSTRIRTTKVKKRKGVGTRTITVLDSDEEDALPTSTHEYARVTKTRVGTSGKAEGFAVSSVPVFQVEVNIRVPLEENVNDLTDAIAENIVPPVPTKKPKKANDSVSSQPSQPLHIAENPSDQDALLA